MHKSCSFARLNICQSCFSATDHLKQSISKYCRAQLCAPGTIRYSIFHSCVLGVFPLVSCFRKSYDSEIEETESDVLHPSRHGKEEVSAALRSLRADTNTYTKVISYVKLGSLVIIENIEHWWFSSEPRARSVSFQVVMASPLLACTKSGCTYTARDVNCCNSLVNKQPYSSEKQRYECGVCQ